MTILDCMMKALSVRELHEIPGVLMDVLLDHNKLERLIANMSGYYSYSGLLQEFEEKAADRKKLYARLYASKCYGYRSRYIH